MACTIYVHHFYTRSRAVFRVLRARNGRDNVFLSDVRKKAASAFYDVVWPFFEYINREIMAAHPGICYVELVKVRINRFGRERLSLFFRDDLFTEFSVENDGVEDFLCRIRIRIPVEEQ